MTSHPPLIVRFLAGLAMLVVGVLPPTSARASSFAFVDNRIFVTTTANGHPITCIVDTGAQSLLLDAAVARRLGLTPHTSGSTTGVGARTVRVGHTTVATFDFSGRRFHRVAALIVDLEPMRRAIGFAHLDGIIGMAAFRHLALRVDNDRDTVSLEETARVPASAHVLHFRSDDEVVRVPIGIGALTGTAVVDTGDRAAVSLFRPFAARHALYAPAMGQRHVVTGYGLGGPTYADLIEIPALSVFGYRLTSVPARASRDVSGIFGTAPEAGTIGGGVLRRFNAVYDFQRGTLSVWPSRHFRDRSIGTLRFHRLVTVR